MRLTSPRTQSGVPLSLRHGQPLTTPMKNEDPASACRGFAHATMLHWQARVRATSFSRKATGVSASETTFTGTRACCSAIKGTASRHPHCGMRTRARREKQNGSGPAPGCRQRWPCEIGAEAAHAHQQGRKRLCRRLGWFQRPRIVSARRSRFSRPRWPLWPRLGRCFV
jgi:hypothetical protein